MDYSLELLKLREVYAKIFRRKDFSFLLGRQECTKQVINVTFLYSVKAFNQVADNLYIRAGYSPDAVSLADGACIKDGVLVAIEVNTPIDRPLPPCLLESFFCVRDGRYQVAARLPTLVTAAAIRRALYQNGFLCDGVRYVRYKRSAGSSRVGKCLFINEALYPRMRKWELCGLSVKAGQPVDLAALEAYIALPLSSIIGCIRLTPKNILVIPDYESVFADEAIVTGLEGDGLRSRRGMAEIRNRIWEGQSLICPEAMGEYAGCGFILLRNRFFKSACFNTNLRQWFADNNITRVSQLKGFTLAEDLSDIKLITTPSSIKYLKFGPLQQWLDNLDPTFGVVKHEKQTRFFQGRMVQTHYQLLNTLQLSYEEVGCLLAPSLHYLSLLKTCPAVLRYHIKYNESQDSPPETTGVGKNDLTYRLLGHNAMFAQTRLYADFRQDLIKAFLKKLRCGHILVGGTYAVLFGNPVEMLQEAIGRFRGISQLGAGSICCSHFAYGAQLLGSRSPHITQGNILLAKNVDNRQIRRYFNLSPQIACVNSIGENLLARLSGCDFDSDSLLLTDDPLLLEAAQRNYHNFLVPTGGIPAQKIVRTCTHTEKAELDSAASVNKIGEIVNLAQELNSLLWDLLGSGLSVTHPRVAELYNDISTLDILSNIEIDKAKKDYQVDSIREIAKIREKYLRTTLEGAVIKPLFFQVITQNKKHANQKGKAYIPHKCTMDYIQQHLDAHRLPRLPREYLPLSRLLRFDGYCSKRVNYRQARHIIEMLRKSRRTVREIWAGKDATLTGSRKYRMVEEENNRLSAELACLKINNHTMYWLLSAIEQREYSDLRRAMFRQLFSSHTGDFYRMIEKSSQKVEPLVECSGGSLNLYGFLFQ